MFPKWAPGLRTPDGELLHSVRVDPRDARHLYLAISIGGVFESTDHGADWAPLNEGVAADFLPDPNAAYGHDPHCVIQHPLQPDRLYQQNHCGSYRLDRPARRWVRIGEQHADGASATSAFRSSRTRAIRIRSGCSRWTARRCGRAPRSTASPPSIAAATPAAAGSAWIAACRARRPGSRCCARRCARIEAARLGLYFGTTQGEVWASIDEGESWRCIARHLPEIYSVTHAA